MNSDFHVDAIKAFVPARDYALSLRYYQALGFDLAWEGDGLAELRHGDACFLLQDFHVAEHAANFMMSMMVRQLDAWHARARGVAEAFGVRIGAPELRPWGLRDFTLFDPTGVLWRIAESKG